MGVINLRNCTVASVAYILILTLAWAWLSKCVGLLLVMDNA